MWLLNTHTAELKFFAGPEHVPGGYAILSHVWGNPERDLSFPYVRVDKIPDEEDTLQKVRDAYEESQQNVNGISEDGPFNKQPRSYPSASLAVRVRVLEDEVHKLAAQLQDLTSVLHSLKPASAVYRTFSMKHPRYHPHSLSKLRTCDDEEDQRSASSPTNARDFLSEKIRGFLLQAQEHGFDWAWADTCCIDKTSSTELTEAINSMFDYYTHSDVCYAYLSDVPPFCGADSWLFRSSQWHARGWTLQELIAPQNVIFMASDWSRIGTKYELADILGAMTNMPPASVLRFEKDISEMSIAQRMSWAADRSTTRIEDEAYCLFGLFGVNMPTLYGEGENAFYRLQEVIMSKSPDTSLFGWSGSKEHGVGHSIACRTRDITGEIPSILGWREERDPGLEPLYHLLAPSPRHFQHSKDIVWCGAQQYQTTSAVRGVSE